MNVFISALICCVLLILSCNSRSNTEEKIGSKVRDSIESEKYSPKIKLSDSQKKIVKGAKENLSENAEYDLTMGYYILTYLDEEDTGSRVYPNGDLNPGIGVCTDVIVRSLRHAGIADLQKEIHEDIDSYKSDYPFSRWGNKKPDTNIDHRRVMNLEVWFSKYWETVTDDNFLPGDIVVWDMDEDGASDHIGIVSDTFTGERFKVIHNHPDPGYIADEDKIFNWNISGHFRVTE